MVKRHGKVEIALMCVDGTSQENLFMGPVGISLSRSRVHCDPLTDIFSIASDMYRQYIRATSRLPEQLLFR